MAELTDEELDAEIEAVFGAQSEPVGERPRAPKQDKPAEPKTSRAAAAGLGALQGATMQFADEIGAAGNAIWDTVMNRPDGEEIMSYLFDTYRENKEAISKGYKKAEEDRPGASLAGNLAGGAATALLLPGGAPATFSQAAKVGAIMGAANAAGASEADLTTVVDPRVEWGDAGGEIARAGIDTALGATVGAGAGLAGHAIAKGAGAAKDWAVRRLTGNKVAPGTEKMAAQAAASADEQSLLVPGQTVKEFAKDSAESAAQVGADIGEPVALNTYQATGTMDAAAMGARAAQDPKFAQAIRRDYGKQVVQLAKQSENLIREAAADPAKLDNPTTGKLAEGAIKRFVEALRAERGTKAGRLYDEAYAATGGKRVVVTDNFKTQLSQELQDLRLAEKTGWLKRMNDLVEEFSTGTGRLSVRDAHEVMKQLGRVSAGKQRVTDELVPSEQQALAKRLLAAIHQDLDETAKGIAGKGAAKLREANAVWRAYSEEMDTATSTAVRKLLGMADDEAAENIPNRLASMTGEARANVMRMLASDKPALMQMRAQALKNIFRDEAKIAAPGSVGAKMATQQTDAGTIAKAMNKNFEFVESLFPDEPQMVAKLRAFAMLADRAAIRLPGEVTGGKGTEGFVKWLVGELPAGAVPGALIKAADAIVRKDPAKAYEIFAAPKGIDAALTIMQARMNPSKLAKTADGAAKVAEAVTVIAGILGAKAVTDKAMPHKKAEPEPAVPMPAEPVADDSEPELEITPTNVRRRRR